MKVINTPAEEVSFENVKSMDLSYELFCTHKVFQDFYLQKNEILNKASYDIKAVEKLFRDSRIDESFEWTYLNIKYEEGTRLRVPTWSLAWRQIQDGKFRLVFGAIDLKTGITDWKPLIECKSDQRFLAYEYLPYFVSSFSENLKNKLAIDTTSYFPFMR